MVTNGVVITNTIFLAYKSLRVKYNIWQCASGVLSNLIRTYVDCEECTRKQKTGIYRRSSLASPNQWLLSPFYSFQTSLPEGSSQLRVPLWSSVHRVSLSSSTLVSPASGYKLWENAREARYYYFFFNIKHVMYLIALVF